MPWPTETSDLADPTPAPEMPQDPAVWMAQELVCSNREGHRDTQTEIRALGDRLEHGLTTYARLIVLSLAIVAGLSGLRLVLPDGTTIEPTAEAADVAATLDSDAPAHTDP